LNRIIVLTTLVTGNVNVASFNKVYCTFHEMSKHTKLLKTQYG